MGMNPYEIRLECFNKAMQILVGRYEEQQTQKWEKGYLKYPTTEEILGYAKQINTFISDTGEGNK